MTTDGDNPGMNRDALTAWLASNPSASDDAPDLVALAQYLAREIDGAEKKDLAGLAREYRMVLKELRGLGGGDDGEETLASSMRTPLLHPKDP